VKRILSLMTNSREGGQNSTSIERSLKDNDWSSDKEGREHHHQGPIPEEDRTS
jgi:hypothetical protein